MASQKRSRPTAGQGKSGGTATRLSGNADGRAAGNRTASPAPGARTAGKPARAQSVADRRQSQTGRGQNGRGQNGRPRNGRPQSTRPGQGRTDGSARAGALTAEASADQAAEARYSAPPWLRWAALALSLAGLGVSVYLTIVHYTSTALLACSSKGYIDCAKVTTSSQSMVFGVLPVAVLGLAFYVFMVAINTPWAWRAQLPAIWWARPAIWWARLGSAVVGIGFVLYLVYAEVIQLDNICLWCTSVHVITFLLFVLLVFAATLSSGETAKTAASPRPVRPPESGRR
jgi:uncharacterized membrane protein